MGTFSQAQMRVLVQVETYIDTHYDGSILVDEETFRVERRFPWQHWTLLHDFDAYDTGDKWEGLPIHPNRKYTIEFGGGHKVVQTQVIG